MFNTMFAASAFADLVGSRGAEARFGVRVRVTAYSENVASVWVLVACKYRDVDN